MKSFEELISVIQTLRGENGCAWDKVQTFDSLIPCFLEEAYEVVEAINNRDYENIKEELGDVLLHVVFFSELAKDENKFNIDDVCKNISEKLIRRHPHVFGNSDVKDVQGILKQWDKIKKEEKASNNTDEFKSVLDGIPKSLPIMEKSYKLMKKAASVGFEYEHIDDSLSKIEEELLEVKDAYKEQDKEHLEEEIGDLIMTVLDFARMNKINPVNSLIKVNEKFRKRFNYVEKSAYEMNKKLEDMSLAEMDNLWNEYKKKERENK
ncbi:nucleoside triphosphate pyrophosphohydrolase [Brachyspira hyodysenteriae]|uniref:Nucleoside triphosphate pyrophosphohydrolase n=2 Tax=Brachyspira hyodysenteriae TaxID=159 RepID=A0A3B6VAB5_BRAHW|nr:nucleoside triphosphate pyrophosphohydrolase [Brachyspira hyodysenteriae]ACN84795.1 nucleoside triphosphate pyrophosphohydrolase [Brachyspira hyodysenteriae WA1]ANN63145.1 nucleoside triphosphate pyrophosphohydrolase [Brachyspira hyodysenteriae ATCC 27164]KLI16778.1 pyrophosphatase [Brachyspira hyodysenteriae]KLI24774.1 pyrophosphatase [Brachyspira hyodysenteriae]KLI26321.1 pyrophosphatase [Brachyspira hyodysenteriae]